MGIFGKKSQDNSIENPAAHIATEPMRQEYFEYDAISDRRKRERWQTVRRTFAAMFFAFLFLMPTVLTFTNSFMTSSEINANYGAIFATNNSGGKIYVSEVVNLKFIPDMVSFGQYITVLFKSPEYLMKFWNSVIYVVPIVIFQLFIASLASFGFARYRGKGQTAFLLLIYCPHADALPGHTGPQLYGCVKAWDRGHPLGHMAARHLFALCGLYADQIYAPDSLLPVRGGVHRRRGRVADLHADLHADLPGRPRVDRHPGLHRLLEHGGAAADPAGQ